MYKHHLRKSNGGSRLNTQVDKRAHQAANITRVRKNRTLLAAAAAAPGAKDHGKMRPRFDKE